MSRMRYGPEVLIDVYVKLLLLCPKTLESARRQISRRCMTGYGYMIRSCLGTTTTVALRQSPGLCTNNLKVDVVSELRTVTYQRVVGSTHLAFGIRPKVDDHSHKVVNAGIGALVDQKGAEGEKRDGGEASLETAVNGRSSQESYRPLPR